MKKKLIIFFFDRSRPTVQNHPTPILFSLQKMSSTGVKFILQNYYKHQKHTNPLFYSDCYDFFILDFICDMSQKKTSVVNISLQMFPFRS